MTEKISKLFTLCLVRDEGRVLLGMKKRGFGAGKWNGFGGKVTLGETIKDAAKRELREELGIEALSLEKQGILNFVWPERGNIHRTHIFSIREYTGDPIETEEM